MINVSHFGNIKSMQWKTMPVQVLVISLKAQLEIYLDYDTH